MADIPIRIRKVLCEGSASCAAREFRIRLSLEPIRTGGERSGIFAERSPGLDPQAFQIPWNKGKRAVCRIHRTPARASRNSIPGNTSQIRREIANLDTPVRGTVPPSRFLIETEILVTESAHPWRVVYHTPCSSVPSVVNVFESQSFNINLFPHFQAFPANSKVTPSRPALKSSMMALHLSLKIETVPQKNAIFVIRTQERY